ncbi:hypothetical protein NHX12_007157 [Muraenolepis orangiensis]|uniref:Uncharacterized protein n=1 Tax=Muraenolepis orangiensis TaxID=630683 RepID=A0A9Q0DPG5_9TELE|nr:hypothetical protein NHX12_007157 [Muraenolepis orangiensis]
MKKSVNELALYSAFYLKGKPSWYVISYWETGEEAVQVLLDLPPGDRAAAFVRRFGQHQSTDESLEKLRNCCRREGSVGCQGWSPRDQPPGSRQCQPPGGSSMSAARGFETSAAGSPRDQPPGSRLGGPRYQCHELKKFLDDNVALYAASDKDCTRTRLDTEFHAPDSQDSSLIFSTVCTNAYSCPSCTTLNTMLSSPEAGEKWFQSTASNGLNQLQVSPPNRGWSVQGAPLYTSGL